MLRDRANFQQSPLDEPQRVIDQVTSTGVLNCVADTWTLTRTCPAGYPGYYYHLGSGRRDPYHKSCLYLDYYAWTFENYSPWYTRYDGTCANSISTQWKNLLNCLDDTATLGSNLYNAVRFSAHTFSTTQSYYTTAKRKALLNGNLASSYLLSQSPSPDAETEKDLLEKDYQLVDNTLDCSIVRESLINYAGNGCFEAAQPLALQAIIVSFIALLTFVLSCYLGTFLKRALIDLKVEEKKDELNVDDGSSGSPQAPKKTEQSFQQALAVINQDDHANDDEKQACYKKVARNKGILGSNKL